jgi:hypothetical protein
VSRELSSGSRNQEKSFVFRVSGLLVACATIGAISPAFADERAAVNGCVARLKTVGGPDARNGITVVSSEFSQAGTLVILRDAGETTWRCLAYSDGKVGELSVASAADDGGGAMAGSQGDSRAEPTTATQRVQFAKGRNGATLSATLTPGSSIRYVLGAKKNQFLNVRVDARNSGIEYQIFNPDRSFLLEQISSSKPYRGQLWQTGDHVVEVINRGNGNASISVTFNVQ